MEPDAELRTQLEELRQENRKLKVQLQEKTLLNTSLKTIRYTIGSYKGHPVITFEGIGRPFSIGLKKASVLLACHNEIARFVDQHNATLSDYSIETSTHAPRLPSQPNDHI
jgi:hypothetical protein